MLNMNENEKVKIFLDFDNTICNSIKAFCFVYNISQKEYTHYADWTKVDLYNFNDQCPNLTKEQIEDIFANPLFFQQLEFINENTYEVLEKLSKHYEIIICSIGTLLNISFKTQWIKKNLPFIKESIFIVNDGCKMNKSIVDMKDSIIIDDVASNLETSNARFKIAFGSKHEWNRNYINNNKNTSNVMHCVDWNGISNLLLNDDVLQHLRTHKEFKI